MVPVMSDQPAQDPRQKAANAPEAAPPATPFDHPLFLPVLLVAGCAWFGYDAYLNQDPEMLEHLAFNRFGLRVLIFLAVLFGYRGWAEQRECLPHPMVVPGLIVVMALWLAYDGWISQDPFNLEYKSFDRAAALGLLLLSAGFGWAGAVRLRGAWEPLLLRPVLVLAVGAALGLRARESSDLMLIHAMASAGMLATGIWLGVRGFRERREAAAPYAHPDPEAPEDS
jgi:hypothetical protein